MVKVACLAAAVECPEPADPSRAVVRLPEAARAVPDPPLRRSTKSAMFLALYFGIIEIELVCDCFMKLYSKYRALELTVFKYYNFK